MAAISQNATMFAMKAGTLIFTLTDAATGDPLDLTGATLRWCYAARAGSDPLLLKTEADGITVPAPATGGVAEVELATGELANAGTFHHELEVTLSGESAQIVAVGTLFIRPVSL